MPEHKNSTQYVICIRNKGSAAWLETGKIYRRLPDSVAQNVGMIRVIDESGEDYLYSPDYFLPITVSPVVGGALQITSGEITRVSVHSNTVVSIGYDGATGTLDVEFRKTGEIYRYHGVPPSEYQSLMNAPSIGAYLNRQFKQRGYKYEVIFPSKRTPKPVDKLRIKTRIRSARKRKASLNL